MCAAAGKPRGCVTWLEDVEKKVPVKVKKEVEKIKKVERRRPVKNLPADKVLSYDLTRVIREVSMAGTITVAGADQKPVAFRVLKESRDTSNDEVKHTRMTISADPMEADALEVVKENAAKEVARASARASARAIRAWMRDVRAKAQQAAADTKMDQAEELYLQLIALGIPADDQLKRFFKTRYGQSLDDIFNPLSVVLGRELIVDRSAKKRRRKFPSKMPSAGKFPKKLKKAEPAPKPVTTEQAPVDEPAQEEVVEPVAEPTNEVDDAFDSALGSDEDDAPEKALGPLTTLWPRKLRPKKRKPSQKTLHKKMEPRRQAKLKKTKKKSQKKTVSNRSILF